MLQVRYPSLATSEKVTKRMRSRKQLSVVNPFAMIGRACCCERARARNALWQMNGRSQRARHARRNGRFLVVTDTVDTMRAPTQE